MLVEQGRRRVLDTGDGLTVDTLAPHRGSRQVDGAQHGVVHVDHEPLGGDLRAEL